MTAHSPGAQSQVSGPDSAIEVLEWLEEITFQIIFTAFFGPTTTNDQSSLEDLLKEFRDAFSISLGLSAQAEMVWETILPSYLFFGLIPVDDIRKTEQSMRGIKNFCQKQIAQRKSEVRAAFRYCSTPPSVMLSNMIADFVFNFSTRLSLVLYPTRTS
jgi:hypothetical protein